MSGAAHAGDHGRNRRMTQTEAQGELGQLVQRDGGIFGQPLQAIPNLLLAVAAKILMAEVALGKGRVRTDFAGQASFVEGHAGENADVVLLAVGKKFVVRRLVKDIVDDLDGVNEAGRQRNSRGGSRP